MSRILSLAQWSELKTAREHLGLILQSTARAVTDEQWSQLQTMSVQFGEIVGVSGPFPSASLLPSSSVYP